MRAALLGAVTAALAVAFTGCGGGGDAEPVLPPGVAEELAGRSEAVADLLAGGDQCAADEEARALVRAVEAAIAAGDVPAELRGELVAAAAELEAGIECEEVEPPAAAPTPGSPDDPPADDPSADDPPADEPQEEAPTEPVDEDACVEVERRLEEVEARLDVLGDVVEDREERRREEEALKDERRTLRDALEDCERDDD